MTQINARNKQEQAPKTLIADLMHTQKELRSEQYKFSICNKQPELLARIAELEAGLVDKSKEMKSL